MKIGIFFIYALLVILSGCTITKNIVLSNRQLACQEEAVDSDQFYREHGIASMPIQFTNLAYDKAINNARQSLINRVANCSNSSFSVKIGSMDVVCSRYSTDNKEMFGLL